MNHTQHLLRSSLLVIFIFGINKVTGFVKLLLTTAIFGTGPAADALASARQLPELFEAMLIGGALGAALIPVYSAYLTAQENTKASKLANTVLTLALLVVGGVCIGAALGAPWITRVLLVPDFAPEQQALTAELMRILLVATAIFAVGSVFSSLLHAHQHFFAPALGTVAVDLGQIVGLYVLTPYFGIHGVAWGSVIGALLLVVVQLPQFVRHRIAQRPQLALRLDGVHELAHLMWPRVITLGAVQAVDLVVIRLASQLPGGSISAYFYAMLVMVFMPKSLFGAAISTVFFPTLAEQFNTGRAAELRRTVTRALQAAWALIIPGAVGLLALGEPGVAFLLQRGAFGAEATALVYVLLGILAIRLISEASQEILMLPFYAHHNTRVPMWAQLAWMALHIGLSVALVGPLGIRGLAWAASISAAALALGMYVLNRWLLDGLEDAALRATLGRVLLACAGMSAVIAGVHMLALATLPFLVTAIGAGGLTYVLIYTLSGGDEVRTLLPLLAPSGLAARFASNKPVANDLPVDVKPRSE